MMKKSVALVLAILLLFTQGADMAYAANNQYYEQVLQENRQQRNTEVDPNYYLEMDDEEFKQLSDKIVGNIKNDYDKVKAIHDWVCENVYYDYEAYEEGFGFFVVRSDAEAKKFESMSAYERLMTYKRGGLFLLFIDFF